MLSHKKKKGKTKHPCYLNNKNIEDENETQRIKMEYLVQLRKRYLVELGQMFKKLIRRQYGQVFGGIAMLLL